LIISVARLTIVLALHDDLSLACMFAQDPYSYGAYSYVPPHGRKAYYEWLSYPGAQPPCTASYRLPPLIASSNASFCGSLAHGVRLAGLLGCGADIKASGRKPLLPPFHSGEVNLYIHPVIACLQ
jgi:hypothetical protein